MRKNLVSKKYGRKVLSIALAAALTVSNFATTGFAGNTVVEAANKIEASQTTLPTLYRPTSSKDLEVQTAALKEGDILIGMNGSKKLKLVDDTQTTTEKNRQGEDVTVYYGDVDGSAKDIVVLPDGTDKPISGKTDLGSVNYIVTKTEVETVKGSVNNPKHANHLRRHVIYVQDFISLDDSKCEITVKGVTKAGTDFTGEEAAGVPTPAPADPGSGASLFSLSDNTANTHSKFVKFDKLQIVENGAKVQNNLASVNTEASFIKFGSSDAIKYNIGEAATVSETNYMFEKLEKKYDGGVWGVGRCYQFKALPEVSVDASRAFNKTVNNGVIEWDNTNITANESKVVVKAGDTTVPYTDLFVKADIDKVSRHVGKYTVTARYLDDTNYGMGTATVEVKRTNPQVWMAGNTGTNAIATCDMMVGDALYNDPKVEISADNTKIVLGETVTTLAKDTKVDVDTEGKFWKLESIKEETEAGTKYKVFKFVEADRTEAEISLEGAKFNYVDKAAYGQGSVVSKITPAAVDVAGTTAIDYSSYWLDLANVKVTADGKAVDAKVKTTWYEADENGKKGSALGQKPQGAGTYVVEAEIDGSDMNYVGSAKATAVVKINRLNITLRPTADNVMTYGDVEPAVKYEQVGAAFQDNDLKNSPRKEALKKVLVRDNSGVKTPGTYNIVINSDDDVKNLQKDYKISIDMSACDGFVIKPLNLSDAKVEVKVKNGLGPNGSNKAYWTGEVIRVYDASETPDFTITVKSKDGKGTISADNYVISTAGDSKNYATNIGTYQITIAAGSNGNLTGSVDKPWEIVEHAVKATAKKVVVPYGYAYDNGSNDKFSYQASAADLISETFDGDYKITYTYNGKSYVDAKVADIKLTDVGVYEIPFKVEHKADADKWIPAEGTAVVEIRQKDVAATALDQTTVPHWSDIENDANKLNVPDLTLGDKVKSVEFQLDKNKYIVPTTAVFENTSKKDVTSQYNIEFKKSTNKKADTAVTVQLYPDAASATAVYAGPLTEKGYVNKYTAKATINSKKDTPLTEEQMAEVADIEMLTEDTLGNVGDYNLKIYTASAINVSNITVNDDNIKGKFKVTARPLSAEGVKVEMDQTAWIYNPAYPDAAMSPTIKFTYENEATGHKETEDLTASCASGSCIRITEGSMTNTQPGTYKVKVEGIGNFTGEQELEWSIGYVPDKAVYYDGKAHTLNFSNIPESSKIVSYTVDGNTTTTAPKFKDVKYDENGKVVPYVYEYTVENSNGTKTELRAELTINPVPVIVKAKDGKNKKFGQADPAMEATEAAIVTDEGAIDNIYASTSKPAVINADIKGLDASKKKVVTGEALKALSISFVRTSKDIVANNDKDEIAAGVSTKDIYVDAVIGEKVTGKGNYIVFNATDNFFTVKKADKVTLPERVKRCEAESGEVYYPIYEVIEQYKNELQSIDVTASENVDVTVEGSLLKTDGTRDSDYGIKKISVNLDKEDYVAFAKIADSPSDTTPSYITVTFEKMKNITSVTQKIRVMPATSAPDTKVEFDSSAKENKGEYVTAKDVVGATIKLVSTDDADKVAKVEYAVISAKAGNYKDAADIATQDAAKAIVWKSANLNEAKEFATTTDGSKVLVKLTSNIINAGNASVSYSVSPVVKLDNVAPEVHVANMNKNPISNGDSRTEALRVRVAELSGISKIEVKVYDANGKEVKPTDSNSVITSMGGVSIADANKVPTLVEGKYTFKEFSIPANKYKYVIKATDIAGNVSEAFVINPSKMSNPAITANNETILGKFDGNIVIDADVSVKDIYVSTDAGKTYTKLVSGAGCTVKAGNTTMTKLISGEYKFRTAPGAGDRDTCYVSSDAVNVSIKSGNPISVTADAVSFADGKGVEYVVAQDNSYNYNSDIRFNVVVKDGYILTGAGIAVTVAGFDVETKLVDVEYKGETVSAYACTVKNVTAPAITVKVLNGENVIVNPQLAVDQKAFSEYKVAKVASLEAIAVDAKYVTAAAIKADAVKTVSEMAFVAEKSLVANKADVDAVVAKAEKDIKAAMNVVDYAEYVSEVAVAINDAVSKASVEVVSFAATKIAEIEELPYNAEASLEYNKAVVKVFFDKAVAEIKDMIAKEEEEKNKAELEAAKKAFEEFKSVAVASANALVVSGDSAEVKAIVDETVKSINEAKFDETKNLEANKADLVDLVDFTSVLVEAQREIEAAAAAEAAKKAFAEFKKEMIDAVKALAVDGSAEVKLIAAEAAADIATIDFDEAKTLDENKAVVNTIVDTAKSAIDAQKAAEAEAAKKAAFEEYKAIVVANAKAVATATDSAAVVDLVAASAAAIEAVEYDATKTFDESKAALDQMLVDLVAAVNELRNSAVEVIPGDVDMDGEVTLDDVLLALQAALKVQTVEGDAFVAADVDGDQDITLDDVLVILQLALKVK